jgi:hypothetical protein
MAARGAVATLQQRVPFSNNKRRFLQAKLV